jgi:hypothetical protein
MALPIQQSDEPSGFVQHRTARHGLAADPISPVPFDAADRAALKALRDGNASPDQQQRGLGWILFAAGDHDLPWRPGGQDGARATDMMLGRLFVARQIRRLLAMPSKAGELGEQN